MSELDESQNHPNVIDNFINNHQLPQFNIEVDIGNIQLQQDINHINELEQMIAQSIDEAHDKSISNKQGQVEIQVQKSKIQEGSLYHKILQYIKPFGIFNTDFEKRIIQIVYLQKQSISFLFKNILHFVEKTNKFQQCPIIFRSDQRVYQCMQCQQGRIQHYLCESCFKNSNHKSHHFVIKVCQSSQSLLKCSCGYDQVLESKSFCFNHKKSLTQNSAIQTFFSKQKPLSEVQQRKNALFIEVFGILINLARVFYYSQKFKQQGTSLYKLIYLQISSYSNNSTFYSQLFARLFTTKIIVRLPNDIETLTKLEKQIKQKPYQTHLQPYQSQKYIQKLKKHDKISLIQMIILYGQAEKALDIANILIMQVAQCYFYQKKYRKEMLFQLIQVFNKSLNFNQSSMFKNLIIATLYDINIYEDIARKNKLALFPYCYQTHLFTILDFVCQLQDPPIQMLKIYIEKKFIQKYVLHKNSSLTTGRIITILKTLQKLLQNEQDDHVKMIMKNIIQYTTSSSNFYLLTLLMIILNQNKIFYIPYKKIFNKLQIQQKSLLKYAQLLPKTEIFKRNQPVNLSFKHIFRILDQYNQLDNYFDDIYRSLQKIRLTKLKNNQKTQKIYNAFSLALQNILNIIDCQTSEKVKNCSQYQIKSPEIFEACKLEIYRQLIKLQPYSIKEKLNSIISDYASQYKNQITEFIQLIIKYNPTTLSYSFTGYKPYDLDSQKYKKQKKQSYEVLKTILDNKRMKIVRESFIEHIQQIKISQQEILNEYDQKQMLRSLTLYNKIDKLMNYQIPQLRQFMQDIRNKKLEILKVIPKNKKLQENLIYQLKINIKEKQQQMQQKQKNQKFDKETQIKKKMLQMKRKKFQQMKNKQTKFQIANEEDLQIQNKQLQKQEEDQQMCLLCHHPIETQNQLCVTFIHIFKKDYNFIGFFKPISKSFDIKSCGHVVHQSCFINHFGQQVYFLCPLCKGVFNSIVPKNQIKQIQNTAWFQRLNTLIDILFKNSQQKDFLNKILFNVLLSNKLGQVFSQVENSFHIKKEKQFIFKIIKQIYKINKHSRHQDQLEFVCCILNSALNSLNLSSQISKYTISQKVNRYFLCYIYELIIFKTNQKYQNTPFQERLDYLYPHLSENLYEKIVNLLPIREKQILKNKTQTKNEKKTLIFDSFNDTPKWNTIFPQQAKQYLNYFKINCNQCQTDCKQIWICLVCSKTFCKNYLKQSLHFQNSHSGDGVSFSIYNASIYYHYRGYIVQQTNLYTNFYGDSWNRNKSCKGYFLNKQIIQQFQKCFTFSQIPKSVYNRQHIIEILNDQNYF